MEKLESQIQRVEEQLKHKEFLFDHYSFFNLYHPGIPMKKVTGTLQEVITECRWKGYKKGSGKLLIAANSIIADTPTATKPLIVPRATIMVDEDNSLKIFEVGIDRMYHNTIPDAFITVNLHNATHIPGYEFLRTVMDKAMYPADYQDLREKSKVEKTSFSASLGQLPFKDVSRGIDMLEKQLFQKGYQPPFTVGAKTGSLKELIMEDLSRTTANITRYSDDLYEVSTQNNLKINSGSMAHHLSISHQQNGLLNVERIITRQFQKQCGHVTICLMPVKVEQIPDYHSTKLAMLSILKKTFREKKGLKA